MTRKMKEEMLLTNKKNCTAKSFFVLEINTLTVLMTSLTSKAQNCHILSYIKGHVWNNTNSFYFLPLSSQKF